MTTATSRPPTLGRLLGPGAVETAIFALSLLTGPVVSRALGEDGRGSLAAVLVPTQLVGWVLLLGVPYGSSMLIRRADRQALLDGAWRVALLIATPICAVLWLLAPSLLGGHPTLTVGWFRAGLVGAVLSIPTMTAVHLGLMRHGASWKYALARGVHLVGYSVAVVAFALAGDLSLGRALGCWIGAYLVSRLGLVVAFGAWPRGWGTTSLVLEQLRIGRAQAVIAVATTSLGRIDQVFMAVISTSAELGAYAIAATAVQISLPIAKGLADAVTPAAFARDDGALFERAVSVAFLSSLAVGGLTAALAPWLLPTVFGDDFSSSVRLLWLLVPGQILYNTAWVVSARHLGSGRPGVAAKAIVAAATLNVALIVPAVSVLGPEGAAGLTSVCQAVFLIGVWFRRHDLGAPPLARAQVVTA